jgi:hypothetical protein
MYANNRSGLHKGRRKTKTHSAGPATIRELIPCFPRAIRWSFWRTLAAGIGRGGATAEYRYVTWNLRRKRGHTATDKWSWSHPVLEERVGTRKDRKALPVCRTSSKKKPAAVECKDRTSDQVRLRLGSFQRCAEPVAISGADGWPGFGIGGNLFGVLHVDGFATEH